MLICDGRTMTCLNKYVHMLAGVCEVYACPWLLSRGYNSINEYTPILFQTARKMLYVLYM